MFYQLFKKIESKILTKLFIRWVKDEWDVELLQMTDKLIQDRTHFLQTMIDVPTRVEVKGFRNDNKDG